NGRIVGEGSAADLRDDPAVLRAYLGGGGKAAAIHRGRGGGARGTDANRSHPLANGPLGPPCTVGPQRDGRLSAAAPTPPSPLALKQHPREAGRAQAADSGGRTPGSRASPSHATAGSETMIAVDLMINNADVKAAGNATFDRLNPLTGDIAARAAASSADDAVRAADAAAAAFPAWSEMAPAARRALLNKAADLIEAAGAKFAPVM